MSLKADFKYHFFQFFKESIKELRMLFPGCIHSKTNSELTILGITKLIIKNNFSLIYRLIPA